MKKLSIRIIWSVDSRHYILENGLDHEACTFLALHLPHNIQRSTVVVNELVNNWFNEPEPDDKSSLRTIHFNFSLIMAFDPSPGEIGIVISQFPNSGKCLSLIFLFPCLQKQQQVLIPGR